MVFIFPVIMVTLNVCPVLGKSMVRTVLHKRSIDHTELLKLLKEVSKRQFVKHQMCSGTGVVLKAR